MPGRSNPNQVPSSDTPDASSYAIRELRTAGGARCWVVAFSRDSQVHEKRFYWGKLGGPDAARAAALAWRDAALAQAQALSLAGFCAKARSNNASGVPGVFFLRPRRQPQGIWQAKLRLSDGTRMCESFSVLKHGHDAALAMAIAAREAMLRVAGDRAFVHHPVAKRFAAGVREGSAAPGLGRPTPPGHRRPEAEL